MLPNADPLGRRRPSIVGPSDASFGASSRTFRPGNIAQRAEESDLRLRVVVVVEK